MKQEHPSYALVSISRVSGGSGTFFGSALPDHRTHFEISVTRASLEHDEHHFDRYDPGPELLRIRMTAAQFAEMITTMNVYGGTPCTLTRFQGQLVDSPPRDSKVEAQRVHQSFQERVLAISREVDEGLPRMREILEKKSISKDDRKELLRALELAGRRLRDRVPFILEMFQEATQRVAVQAKAEVDAMVTALTHRTGLRELQKKSSFLLLGAGDEDES